MISTVDSILSFARAHEAEMVATIRRFVECESPSDDAADGRHHFRFVRARKTENRIHG